MRTVEMFVSNIWGTWGKGEKKRTVFYLNVLHILKEVHFWIMAISKLNQVFKFWLIWKGLN